MKKMKVELTSKQLLWCYDAVRELIDSAWVTEKDDVKEVDDLSNYLQKKLLEAKEEEEGLKK